MKAETSITKVDFGRWKLVIRQSTALYSYPGEMNIEVFSLVALKVPYLPYMVSSVLTDVVPTAMMRRCSALALFRRSAASSLISHSSVCI